MPDGHAPERTRVAVVDDEARIRDFVAEILIANETLGVAEVVQYEEPVAFLEALQEDESEAGSAYDLLILDVHFENSGLTGVEMLPFIREELPNLPVVLLTGMEGEAVADAQDYDLVYYIPKPVSPDHLTRMVAYYLGLARKSAERIQALKQDAEEYRELVDILENELALRETEEPSAEPAPETTKAFDRVVEILSTVLKTCEPMPSFLDDLERLYTVDFKLTKRTIDTLIHFDLADTSTPGLNIKKVHGAENIYTLRISHKARLFYFQSQTGKRRLLRLDTGHETKLMDRWLKANKDAYTD